MTKILHTTVVIFLVIVFSAWLDPFRDEVSSGNKKFHEKKYRESRGYYKRAEKYAPGENDKKKLSFNKGDSDYMVQDFDSAIANFKRSIQSDDREVQKKAYFNLGNTYLRMGNYKEAINSYINALKIDPNYENAKKNLEYLLRKKENDKKKKKDGNDGNKGQKGKDKDNKKKKNKKDKKKGQDKQKKRTKGRMNKEQIRNILKSMKKKPVRRKKGNAGDSRKLEKYW